MADIRKCEVYGKVKEIKVGSSPLVPVSFAYCKECIKKGLEPYSSLVGITAAIGGFNDLNEAVQSFILRNLKEQKISFETFSKDVESLNQDLSAWKGE